MPIIEATIERDFERVKREINKKVDINSTDESGQTALHHACRFVNESLAKFLVESGANVSARDNDLQTPLHKAVIFENAVELCKMLIETEPNFDLPDSRGNTPLMVAIQAHRLEISKFMVERGADFTRKNCIDESILHLAYFDKDICDYFIELGADVNLPNREGYTPIHMSYHVENAKKLLDPLISTKSGQTALHTAANRNSTEILECIIDSAYDVDTLDNNIEIFFQTVWREYTSQSSTVLSS